MFIVATMFASAQNLQLHYDFGADRGYLTTTLEKFAPINTGVLSFLLILTTIKKDQPKRIGKLPVS
jgi:hypothetical protein